MADKTPESLLLEERKVKALEKIANVLDALTLWFEDIEKDEWSDRVQWYLGEFLNKGQEEKIFFSLLRDKITKKNFYPLFSGRDTKKLLTYFIRNYDLRKLIVL